MGNKILITGCTGFIGCHLTKKFCEKGFLVLGVDNLNDYYDVSLNKIINRRKEYHLL